MKQTQCRNTVMDKCDASNCAVTCSGDITNQNFESTSINGMTVCCKVRSTFLNNWYPFQEVTFTPVGSEGASCDVKCDDLEFTTTCQVTGDSYAWSLPQTLIDKCNTLNHMNLK